MRAVPLLFLLAASVLLAAPVPKGRPTAATSYSADELAKLPFVDADEIPKDWEGKGSGPKSGLVSLAVTLPKAVYDLGEPVEPLFALKNRTDRALGLGFLLNFENGGLDTWNDGRIEIRDVKTKKVVGPGGSQTWASIAGDGPSVPAKSYYTATGDVGTSGDQKALPPGDYELSWRYGWAKSNAVPFTVTKQPHRAIKPFKNVRLIRITEYDERQELRKVAEKESGASETWAEPGLQAVDATGPALMLGTGQLGRFYPTLRRLPETQGKLAASAKWVTKKDEESFTVRLDVTEKGATVGLPGRPHVYLLIETDADAERSALRETLDRLEYQGQIVSMGKPFELTVKLPADWTDEVDAPGPARVAVLLASKELESGWGQREEKKQVEKADAEADHFVLRTAWREMKLPPGREREKRDR